MKPKGHRWSTAPAAGALVALLLLSTLLALTGASARANQGPVAVISAPADGSTFGVNESVRFSAAGSSDPDGNITVYHWVFMIQDWVVKELNETTEECTVAFPLEGRYEVLLTVVDEWRAMGSTAIYINIISADNRPPVAVIDTPGDETSHDLDHHVNFGGASSYDPDGYLVRYIWKFEKDDLLVAESEWDTPNTSYKFAEAGLYKITLTVRDDGGLTGSMVIYINMVAPGGDPPVAVISHPVNGSRVLVGETVEFYANGTDYNGWRSIMIEWDFGDGTTSGVIQWPVAVATHVYETSGAYTVVLTASYPGGETATASVVLLVGDFPATPVAVISHPEDGSTVFVNETIGFYANGTDYMGWRSIMIEWDFGDGTGSGVIQWPVVVATHAYRAPGTYTVELKATYPDGSTATARAAVFAAHRPPPPKAVVKVPDGQEGVTVSGKTVSLPQGKELRLEGSVVSIAGQLSHEWDFGDGTAATGETASHAYSKPGTYKLTYTVSDGRDSYSEELEVNVVRAVHPAAASAPLDNYVLLAGLVVLLVGVGLFLGGTEMGLGLLFPLFFFLYSKIKREEILDNYFRGRISGYIVANPGEHYTSIREALGMNNGALVYHLRRLEEEGLVKSRSEGIYKRFYPAGMRIPEPNGGSLTQVQRMIYDKIIETPGINQSDIAGVLNISNSTVGYHIEALIRREMVRKERSGMRVRYYALETSFEEVEGAVA